MKKARNLLAGILAATVALASVSVWRSGAVRADVSGEEPSENVEITINRTNFPDPNFRNYISIHVDKADPKGVLTQDEIESVTEINCSESGIGNLKGIEYFTALEVLDCSNSERLAELDMSACVALKELYCHGCESLEKLVLTSNVALEELHCAACSALTSLDLSNCVALTRIECSKCHINDLVLGDHPELTSLLCSENYIDELDVTKYPKLKELWCDQNDMSKLKVNRNPNLQTLVCDGNKLKEITVYSSPYLLELMEVETPTESSYLSSRRDDRVYYYYYFHNFNNKYICRFSFDKDVVFVTEAPIYNIKVTPNGSGTATASVSEAAEYTEVTLTATANDGSRFKSWLVVSGSVTIEDPTSATTTFVVGDSDVEIQAVFEKVPRTIKVSTEGNGTASASVSSGYVGTTVTLTAVADSGYQFKEWNVVSGGVTISEPTSATTSFVIGVSDIEIKAIFEAAPTPEPGPDTPAPVDPGQPGDPANPQPGKDPSFEDFVERLYVVALGRASEAEGKAFWVDQVVNKGFTGADCARFFMLGAPEFLGRNLTDDEFVEVLYKTYFDRDSEPDGKAYWLGRLASGTERAVLVEEFIESVEWCNVCAGYGVKSGAKYHKATVPSKNAVKFATRLYTCCLGRDPEAEGLEYWALALTNLDATGYQAASLFFTLPEFVGLKTTNEEYLTRLYTTFMGREPEADGFAYWLGLLNGGTDRVDVMKAFAGCPEFQEICNSYGIERGEI